MKTYRELYFKGTSEQLAKFAVDITRYAVNNWKMRRKTERMKDYLLFEYSGECVDKAFVSIQVGNKIETGKIQIGNILPLEKSTLSIDEYNTVLLKFYSDVIEAYKEDNLELHISEPSTDNFNPTTMISATALRKLELFCRQANKSSVASNPLDQERWFNFICQTVDDGKMFDYSTLVNFLQDKTYFTEKTDSSSGVIGNYAWDEEKAYELASDYDNLRRIIKYYKDAKGV